MLYTYGDPNLEGEGRNGGPQEYDWLSEPQQLFFNFVYHQQPGLMLGI